MMILSLLQSTEQQPSFWSELLGFLSEDSMASMLSWEFWLVFSVVLLIVEVFTSSFLFAALIPGTLLASFASWAGAGVTFQLICFSFGVLVGLMLLRPMFLKKALDKSVPSNVNALVGCSGKVVKEIQVGETGSVRVYSEEWRARSEDEFSVGDTVTVLRVEGNTLIVQ